MKNELARELSLAEGKHQYDNQVKRVLSNKIILAGVYYDIRFSAYLKTRKERIRLLINVEAQKAFYPGYSLTTRGIFYGARMISAQKGTEFAGRDYDNIRKVYSIWICMNAPDYSGNAISKYRIGKEDLIPGIPDQRNTYDKMTVVTVCLNPKSGKGNPLTRMLGLLLSPKIKGKVKIQQLKEEFAIPMKRKWGRRPLQKVYVPINSLFTNTFACSSSRLSGCVRASSKLRMNMSICAAFSSVRMASYFWRTFLGIFPWQMKAPRY